MRISDWSSYVSSSVLLKIASVIDTIALLLYQVGGETGPDRGRRVRDLTEQAVRTRGFGDGGPTFVGGAGDATIAFLRDFDLGFRIRRLRLVARRLSEIEEAHEETLITPFREALYESLSAYLDRKRTDFHLRLRGDTQIGRAHV